MLKTTPRQPLKSLLKIVETILAMSGILIRNITPLRFFVLLLIILNVGLTYFFGRFVTLDFAIGFFVVMFVVRYWLLFAAFGKGGLADKLTARFGETRGYAYYEAATAFLFFYRSTSLNFLIEKTAHSLNIFGDFQTVVFIVAWIMVLGASVINLWATLIVGVDVYYYKDMFVRRPLGTFEVKGPFRYFSNPMYGIGQFNSYGLALLSGSFWGILATALNQLTMYIFYFLCEKPHIKYLFGSKKEKHKISEKEPQFEY